MCSFLLVEVLEPLREGEFEPQIGVRAAPWLCILRGDILYALATCTHSKKRQASTSSLCCLTDALLLHLLTEAVSLCGPGFAVFSVAVPSLMQPRLHLSLPAWTLKL